MKKNVDAAANIYLNEKFFKLIAMSQGGMQYSEPSLTPYFLPPNIDNATLGATLRLVLAGSKKVSAEEFLKIFQSGAIQKKTELEETFAMQTYEYKTKRSMYKNMNSCSVEIVDGAIKIQPMHHKSLDGYTVTNEGPEPSIVSASISDIDLGALLREGFNRCTSAIS